MKPGYTACLGLKTGRGESTSADVAIVRAGGAVGGSVLAKARAVTAAEQNKSVNAL